jgi:hypothetical protein
MTRMAADNNDCPTLAQFHGQPAFIPKKGETLMSAEKYNTHLVSIPYPRPSA